MYLLECSEGFVEHKSDVVEEQVDELDEKFQIDPRKY
jgi:hypothetical protein